MTLIVVTHDQKIGARARRQLMMEDGANCSMTARGRRDCRQTTGIMRTPTSCAFARDAAAGYPLRTFLLGAGDGHRRGRRGGADGARRRRAALRGRTSSRRSAAILVIVLPGRSATGGFNPGQRDHQHAARPHDRRCARCPPALGARVAPLRWAIPRSAPTAPARSHGGRHHRDLSRIRSLKIGRGVSCREATGGRASGGRDRRQDQAGDLRRRGAGASAN
jgi:hypothetical protein